MMERKKASDFHPDVLKLFDSYVHGAIDRREFLARAARYAVGGITAAALLDSLRPDFAWAQQVAKDDKRLNTNYIDYPSPQGHGTVKAYMAKPTNATGKLAAIVVIHENRGLNPYIEDVARRLALENYVAFAPDALSPAGGYPDDEDKARAMFAELDMPKVREDFVAAVSYLKKHDGVGQKIGTVGFCWGGGMANMLAVRVPDLAAAVPYYGPGPSASDTAKINAALQLHYAGEDQRINAGWPAFESALKENDVSYEMYMYEGAQHGFHNDTTPRYDEDSARLAWTRTLGFFKKHLA